MDYYEINEDTLAILPTKEFKTQIIEKEHEYIIDEKPFQVMDYSCQYFGSTYEGREDGCRSMIGINYKTPIVVEESKEIIFFPTNSPQSEECSWISMREVKNILDNQDGTTIITFNNDKKIQVNNSKHSIENQLLRATRLESVLRNRKYA